MAVSDAPVRPVSHAAPPPPPPRHWTYHRIRKTVHLGCFLIFCVLPFFNLMRFDIPRQRFYFAGFELWINEFGIIFFTLMFLMFLVVAMAIVYGRVFCGYMCPQMIFSEASLEAEAWLQRKITRKLSGLSVNSRKWLQRAAFYAVVGAASVALAFVFISYFVEPRDLLGRLMHLDLRTAGGVAGATVTAIIFLDFTLLRQTFCTTVCPYGYLQGMLVDRHTLLVHYRDEGPRKQCVECRKCIRVCHMGIDIRKSPYQMECVHCGECIDACGEIMTRLKRPNLIHYVWGEAGMAVETETFWWRRLGFRDAKRVVILLVVLFYLSGLFTALSMRHAVMVQLMPDRLTLYRVDTAGVVYNTFRVTITNRSSRPARVWFAAEGVPGARLTLDPNPVPIAPGEQLDRRFEVAATRFAGAQEVNEFRLVARADASGEQDSFDETFLMPPERKTP